MPEIKERAVEDAIVNVLTTGRMDGASDGEAREPSPGFGEFVPGGYTQRSADDYDRSLCLIPDDVIDFILATQPKEWGRLKEHYGDEASQMSAWRTAFTFPGRLLKRFIQRITWRYFIADFTPVSLLLLVGGIMFLFGIIFGAIIWMRNHPLGILTPTGTIMLAVVPLVLGFQMLLQALVMDISNAPTDTLQARHRPFAEEDA